MNVVEFKLGNTGCFADSSVIMAQAATHGTNTTVFTGYSGTGKTLLLKSIANSLSWFIARLRDERTAGVVMPDTDIRQNTTQAKLEISVRLNGLRNLAPTIVRTESIPASNVTVSVSHLASPNEQKKLEQVKDTYCWATLKVLNTQGVGTSRVNLDDLMALIKIFKDNLNADTAYSLPIIAYYPLERWVMDTPILAKTVQPTEAISAYDTATPATVNFARFFEWFRDQEDLENERRANAHRRFFNQETPRDIQLDTLYARLEQAQRSFISLQLDAVRTAINTVMPEFSDLRIERHPKLKLLIDKQGTTVNFAQLSQGEKILLAMVGDIARRLATQNPAHINPLHGEGIIMIDEIGLHLHPDTQHTILTRFSKAFPNCQLIVTTLAPDVYRGVPNIVCYALNRGQAQRLPQDYRFNSQSFMQQSTPLAIEDHPQISIETTESNAEIASQKAALTEDKSAQSKPH